MMKILMLFILCAVSTIAAAQADPQNKAVVTDSEPVYPKGDNVLYSEVLYNIKYPEEAKKKLVEGVVTLSFDVKPDSSVSRVMIMDGVGNGVDEEVKKYVEKLKFIPAVQNGKAVKMNTLYHFPVKAH